VEEEMVGSSDAPSSVDGFAKSLTSCAWCSGCSRILRSRVDAFTGGGGGDGGGGGRIRPLDVGTSCSSGSNLILTLSVEEETGSTSADVVGDVDVEAET
jgi:hypothetical protein